MHTVRVAEGELRAGAEVLAQVDPEWRLGARQAHSGTHVVHAALREVLGPDALQSGSYNKPGYLRLDFSWNQALSAAARSEIEDVANRAIRQDLGVGWQYMSLAEAKAVGRDRAVRRDVRRAGPRRRDRRPLVARAVRRHARGPLQPDRPGGR